MPTNRNGNYTGKVAFVTGAGSGIGRAAALAFAREGANVVVADISEQGNQETARMIEGIKGRALAVRCDVTRAEDVKAALDKAVEAFGRLDAAFNKLAQNSRLPQWPILRRRSGTGSSISTSVACFCV
jgi:NAD(P)-dependent dehydrogenase (short-subunit alcohol dehydrogenase family)